MTSSITKRPARLSQPKSFRLASWIAANADSLQHKTFKDIAHLASEHLEFEVSPVSIPPHAEIAGVKLTGKQGGNNKKNADRTQVVAQAVADLYKQLGLSVPEPLRMVCQRQSPNNLESKQ